MADIVTKFSSDDKEMIVAFERQEKLLAKMREQLTQVKKAGEEAAESHNKGAEFLVEQVGALKTMAAGYFTVEKAIEVVSEAYGEWAEQIDQLSEKHEEFERAIIRTIAKTGELKNATQITHALESIKGATPEQGRQAYEAISGSAPMIGLGKKLELAKETAPMGATGIDLNEFGSVAGQLAKIFPGKTPQDIADMTAALQRQTGSDFGAFGEHKTARAIGSLLKSGAVKTPEEALSLGVAAHAADLKPGILETLAAATTEPLDKHKIKTQDLVKFSKAGPEERMRMLRENSAVNQAVLGDSALKMKMLGEGSPESFVRAQQEDESRKNLEMFESGSVPGGKASLGQATAERQAERGRGYWAERATRWKETNEAMKEAGLGGPLRTLWELEFMRQGGTAEAQQNILGRVQQGGVPVGAGGPMEHKQAVDYLEKQTRILERIEANQGKHAPNINAHTEEH